MITISGISVQIETVNGVASDEQAAQLLSNGIIGYFRSYGLNIYSIKDYSPNDANMMSVYASGYFDGFYAEVQSDILGSLEPKYRFDSWQYHSMNGPFCLYKHTDMMEISWGRDYQISLMSVGKANPTYDVLLVAPFYNSIPISSDSELYGVIRSMNSESRDFILRIRPSESGYPYLEFVYSSEHRKEYWWDYQSYLDNFKQDYISGDLSIVLLGPHSLISRPGLNINYQGTAARIADIDIAHNNAIRSNPAHFATVYLSDEINMATVTKDYLLLIRKCLYSQRFLSAGYSHTPSELLSNWIYVRFNTDENLVQKIPIYPSV